MNQPTPSPSEEGSLMDRPWFGSSPPGRGAGVGSTPLRSSGWNGRLPKKSVSRTSELSERSIVKSPPVPEGQPRIELGWRTTDYTDHTDEKAFREFPSYPCPSVTSVVKKSSREWGCFGGSRRAEAKAVTSQTPSPHSKTLARPITLEESFPFPLRVFRVFRGLISSSSFFAVKSVRHSHCL